MGEIAEQLIEQEMFGGHNPSCRKHPSNKKDNFKGIAVYLQSVGLCGKNRAKADVLIIKYAEKVLDMKLEGKRKRSRYAKAIQKDFSSFKKWTKDNYLTPPHRSK